MYPYTIQSWIPIQPTEPRIETIQGMGLIKINGTLELGLPTACYAQANISECLIG